MKKDLSIILPIYNEEKRLRKSLEQIYKFQKENILFSLEFIIVNDGSNDKSDYILKKFLKKKKISNLKYLKIKKNKGKGYALKLGVKKSKKKWILTSDIDLSVPLSQLNIWFEKEIPINLKNSVYFGNREDKKSKINKKFYRYLLGIFFKLIIKILFKIKLKDTQCGFKLYKSEIAKKNFKKIKTYGYAHDIELIKYLLEDKVEIKELPVNWTHKSNSKLNIFVDPFKMLVELIRIYFRSK